MVKNLSAYNMLQTICIKIHLLHFTAGLELLTTVYIAEYCYFTYDSLGVESKHKNSWFIEVKP